MKKVKLKALEAGAKELLSREQLKNVFGGCTSGMCPNIFCDAYYDSSGQNGFIGYCMGVSTDNQGDSSCNCAGLPVTYYDECNQYNSF